MSSNVDEVLLREVERQFTDHWPVIIKTDLYSVASRRAYEEGFDKAMELVRAELAKRKNLIERVQ